LSGDTREIEASIGAQRMSIRPLPIPIHIRPVGWTQIEFGFLAAMCAAGYVSALALAFGGV
jgi:hypothetical protein